MIPISRPHIGDEEVALVTEVLRSGRIGQGPVVAELETLAAEMAGARHAIAVNSGTTALYVALLAHGIGEDDEVVTTPFTFAGTLNAILLTGATARFGDIDLADFNLTPASVTARVNDKTRAILPVHLYGQPADVDALGQLLDPSHSVIVEDAAQAHGAAVNGVPVGSRNTSIFSLYATKNIAAGEGGIITTNDDSVANFARFFRNQGMRGRYEHEMVGHNFRMSDVTAAVAVPQFRRLDSETERRVENAKRLTDGLSGLDGLVVPYVRAAHRHVFHQYTVRVTEDAPLTRDDLATALSGRNIGSGVYYPRVVYDYDCYRAHDRVILDEAPEATVAARQALSLPVHSSLTSGEVDAIIEGIRDIWSR